MHTEQGWVHAFLGFELNPDTRELRARGEAVAIEPKAYDLLSYLVRHADRVVTKKELLAEIWRGDSVSAGVLSQCIWAARQAVGDDGNRQVVIKTIHSKGYRFVAPLCTRPRMPSDSPSTVPPRQVGERKQFDGFEGRGAELDSLREDAAVASLGQGRLRLIRGEAGVGKTRLVEEFARSARSGGFTVLVSRCFEAEGVPPYWPFAQIVRAHCEGRSRDELERTMGSGAADIAVIAPEVRLALRDLPEPARLGAAHARFRLFESFASFVRRVAEMAPLVLIVDDLHNADEASLHLLDFLAGSLVASPVLLLATYRATGWGSPALSGDVAGRLLSASTASVLSLGGLPPEAVEAIISRHAGAPVDSRVVDVIHRATEGNPFLVEETVRMLLHEHGALEGDPTTWAIPVPDTVVHGTASRIRLLPEACRELLEYAAVVGRESELRVLAAASGRTAKQVLDDLEDAAAAGVLTNPSDDPSRFRFGHDLTRQAVYRTLSAARRAECHRDVALALEQSVLHEGDRLDELAHHFVLAAPLGFEAQALQYTLAAAARCTALTAHEEAVVHYERALDLCRSQPVAPAQRAEIRLSLGVAQMRSGAIEAARATLEEAMRVVRETSAAKALARAALDLAPGFLGIATGTTDWFHVRLLEAALDAAGAADGVERARLLGALAVARYWSHPEAERRRLAEEALAIAARLDDPKTSVYVESACQAALWGPDDLEGRLSAARRIVHAAEHLGDRDTALVHRFLRIPCLMDCGHVDTADQEMKSFLEVATNVRQPQAIWYAQRYEAMRALMAGRFEEAEQLALSFLAAGQRLEPENALHSFGAQRATIQWQRGRSLELMQELEPLVRGVDALPSWGATLAFVAADSGHTDVAREEIERLARDDYALVQKNGHYVITIAVLADACSILNDARRARELYAMLLPFERQHVGIYAVLYRGTVRHSLGTLSLTLGHIDEAVSHLEIALSEAQRVGARPFEALAAYELSRALLRQQTVIAAERAGQLLAASHALARELGMEGLRSRIAAIGEPRRRASGAG